MKKLLLLGSISIASLGHAMKQDDMPLKTSSSVSRHSYTLTFPLTLSKANYPRINTSALILMAQENNDHDAKTVLIDRIYNGYEENSNVNEINLEFLFNLNDLSSLSEKDLFVVAHIYFHKKKIFPMIS